MSTVARLNRASGGVALCVVLVGIALSGCSGGGEAKTSEKGTVPVAAPSGTPEKSPGRAENVAGETVTEAPRLLSGEPLAQVASAKGNREIDLGQISARPLSVLVNCQGEGTLTVRVQPMGLSFPLECVDHEVNSTYNELRLKRAREHGTVTVTAPSTVRWAMTIGQ
ncbi:hypothetical protein [Streptomyces sp. NPDC052042]|uniref:hypothetical protein n=1 Tax=Streptomyces sp. NPDC052042 TaxID=3365683 RepID=UPI0037D01AD8